MINQTISHYRIISQLGSGGMGVVYEAEDLTLGRKVALKFLPAQMSRDQNALDRFLFEARTASALNHPNICTIYAVENSTAENGESQSFIAMELLEGQNLSDKLVTGPLPIDRLLDTAIQLADALDAAHAKGIIHRDIKPANIFLTQRNQVKVLDFGLAKLAQREIEMETIGDPRESARAHLTSPGSTVGTIAYMSPEQARGEELDTRTDLFSLGTVIYQMATGRLPFAGSTSAVVFHAILELDPAPVQQSNATLPPKLQEIVEKLLEKDRDLRYQSAADLRGDLKRLKRDTESGKRPPTSSSSIPSAAPSSTSTPSSSATTPSGVAAAARQHKIGIGVTVAVVLLLVVAAVYGVYSLATRRRVLPFQNFSVNKLTDTGDAVLAAISPDGKYILSLMRDNGQAGLWLRNVPTNSNTQVQPPADVYYGGLRFSRDGNYFYFVRSDPGNPELKFLYRAPLLGGNPEKLASDVDSNITFSPDGQQFAFIREDNPEPGKFRLILHSTNGVDERVLAQGPVSEGLLQPDWSPDGKTIVCVALHSGSIPQGLEAIDVATGKWSRIYSSARTFVGSPTWLPDGTGLLGRAYDQSSNFNRAQIVAVANSGGMLSRITRDTNDYADISLAANGRVLATVLSAPRWNLYVMRGPTDPSPRALSPTGPFTNLTWMRDGQIVIDQDNHLSQINLQSGSKATVATEEGHPSGDPSACSDGRYIVFILGFHADSSDQNIWRTDSSGGNLIQLTHASNDTYPVCSPDSQWVYYVTEGEQGKLARVAIDGSHPKTISDVPVSSSALTFDVSPDGKLAAFPTIEHSGEHKERLAMVGTETGKVVMKDLQKLRFGMLHFSPDGKAIVYPTREGGVDNLWEQPLDGSAGKQLTNFTSEHIWDFRWAPDGKQLGLIRGHTDSDVVLIRDAQQ